MKEYTFDIDGIKYVIKAASKEAAYVKVVQQLYDEGYRDILNTNVKQRGSDESKSK